MFIFLPHIVLCFIYKCTEITYDSCTYPNTVNIRLLIIYQKLDVGSHINYYIVTEVKFGVKAYLSDYVKK